MKRKAILSLIVLLLSSLCCGICFACTSSPAAPKVENVAVTAAEDQYGKAGAPHSLTYTVPDGCKVSVSVQLGGKAATAADYACRDGSYYFYSTGEYTVTVYAAKGGMLGSGSARLTVTAGDVFVGEVSLSAAPGETYGRVGALHVLNYVAAAGSKIDVTFEKEGAAADVSFDGTANTVVFGSAGQYEVKVKAALGEKTAEGTAQIEVTAADPPKVGLTLGKYTVKEDETVVLTRSAVCTGGDRIAEETVSALYRKSSSGNFLEAEEESYTVLGDLFTPHAAGEWKIVSKVRTALGAEGEGAATLTCEPAEIELAASGMYRVQTGIPAEIGYTVSGAADKYDVTFDTHGGGLAAVKGDGYAVRVTAETVGYFTVTVTYTHKVDRSLKKTADLTVYSVENLLYAPVWGEDPFGGMPDGVLTSMGHLLCFDAHSADSSHRTYSAHDAEFEVIGSNVSGSNVQILYGAANNADYPYVIVSDFDDNTATGNFTLRMKLTDPYTGYSAVAEKKFNVLPTTNNNGTAVQNICNYVKKHADFYSLGDMDLSMLCSDTRQNMVLTKTGVIMQRTNPDWVLHGADGSTNADFAGMALSAPSGNCRLEFDFTLLAPNYVSGAVQLGIGLRTQNTNGWAGFFDLKAESGRLVLTYEKSGDAVRSQTFGDPLPAVSENTYLGVRIDRWTSGDLATYSVFVRTEKNGEYREYLRCVFRTSSSAGNAGAAVAKYQFTHRNGGGCYAVENVRLEAL